MFHLTSCLLKNAVFWDVGPRRSCVNRRFGKSIASIFRVENPRARNLLTLDISHGNSDTARYFGGTYRLHFQGRIVSKGRSQQKQVKTFSENVDSVSPFLYLSNSLSGLHWPISDRTFHSQMVSLPPASSGFSPGFLQP
jgi:hypothetical protein